VLPRICVLIVVFVALPAAAQENYAEELATDYAFLSMLTLTPDFSAANYKIENDTAPPVKISILRMPFILGAMDLNDKTAVKFELALGYQESKETVPVDDWLSDYADSKWQGYGASLGMLLDYQMSEHVTMEPKIRVGTERLVNTASHHGEAAEFYGALLDGTYLNWNTKSTVVSLGLGMIYDGRSWAARAPCKRTCITSIWIPSTRVVKYCNSIPTPIWPR